MLTQEITDFFAQIGFLTCREIQLSFWFLVGLNLSCGPASPIDKHLVQDPSLCQADKCPQENSFFQSAEDHAENNQRKENSLKIAAALYKTTTIQQGEDAKLITAYKGGQPVCIVSGFSGKTPSYVLQATSNHLAYAFLHDYTYEAHFLSPEKSTFLRHFISNEKDKNSSFYWYKFQLLKDVLARRDASDNPLCQWALWIDSDIVFTNMEQTLTERIRQYAPNAFENVSNPEQIIHGFFSKEEVVAHAPINGGWMMFDNSGWSVDFLEAALGFFSVYKGSLMREQDLLRDMVFKHILSDKWYTTNDNQTNTLSHSYLLPQRTANSFYRDNLLYDDTFKQQWHPGDFAAHLSGSSDAFREKGITSLLKTIDFYPILDQFLHKAKWQEDTGSSLDYNTVFQNNSTDENFMSPWHTILFGSPLLWSKGYYELIHRFNPQIEPNYFYFLSEKKATSEELQTIYNNPKEWIWIRNGPDFGRPSDLELFADTILPQLTQPVRLITTDGDRSIPGQLVPGTAEKILNSDMIIKWYTQNYDGTLMHSKIHPIPIGLDLHCCQQKNYSEKLHTLLNVLHKSLPFQQRKPGILIDGMHSSHSERNQVRQQLAGIPHIHATKEFVPFSQAMEMYAEFQFVVSPRGNGLDTHRTWEILTLGSIPIVRKSSLDVLYENLPVMIIENWEELKDPNVLTKWYLENSDKIASFRPFIHLNPSFWLK